MSDDLAGFIASAKQGAIPDDSVVGILRQNGWSERRIYRALGAYYEQKLGTKVPARTQSGENARDAFLYLLNFITLGFWIVALGQIFYAAIARAFPDAAAYAETIPLRDEVSGQLATVIVAFPLFLFVHYLIARELHKRRDLYYSGVRRWLTYLALVLASLTLLGDAIWFVTALLQGGLTVRFVLDSLVLLVLGGGVFAYYLMTINPPPAQE
ncbi:MAG: hypothetical protein JO029_11010 [Candidatus Eremiobacteraeota bacterium]|nr:hypothetical protein [Candidatus Eremiobacteraeota bacterium]MBV8434796.1 hypothetical protein [Candidatus Eremiobacteraeota bacterium]MBV8723299.1 hypothetical protein [Candidatus Eremiobacteraeota bacterium]